MMMHKRINGILLEDKARIELVPHNGGTAAAIVGNDNKLIAWAVTGWEGVTNVGDVVWAWVRSDFRFIPKSLKKRA